MERKREEGDRVREEKTEPAREKRPVRFLSLRKKILMLIPSGYHTASSVSATTVCVCVCLYLYTCAGVCSGSHYSKQGFRINLWRSRPYPSAQSAHSSRLTHIFSHSH